MPYNSITTRRSSRARREAEPSSEDVIVTPSPSSKTIATSKKKAGGRGGSCASSPSVVVSIPTAEVVPNNNNPNPAKPTSTIAPTRRSGGGRRPATNNSTTTATITTEEEENNTNGNVNINQVVNVPTNVSVTTTEEASEQGQSSSAATTVETSCNRVARISISTRRSAAAARSSISSAAVTATEGSRARQEESATSDCASTGGGGEGRDLEIEEPFGRLAHDIVVIETSSESGDSSKSSVVCEEEEVKGGEEDGSGSEFEGDPGATGCQSFVVIVNPDGTLVLDSEKQIQQLAPGQEKFEVNLPKDKVKSASNPLPGAVQVQPQRARKSRPEGVTYGGSSGFGFVASPARGGQAKTQNRVIEIDLDDPREPGMSVGINHPSHVIQQPSATPIDMDEFTNQLDPQSLATLETLIHSEQGREIIQTLEYNPSATTVCVEVPEAAKTSGWAHSYTGGDKNSTQESSIVSQNPSSVSAGSSAASSPAGSRPSSVGKGGKGRSSSGSRRSEGRSSDRHQRSFDADSDDCFSGDGANIRRSLRQQDRVEKQEAERILAENQKMLQREKEIMKEAVAQTQKALSPGNAAIPSESPNPGPKPATLVAVSSKIASPVPVVRKTSLPVSKVESPITDGKRPYPKRENRKLPAHLADPNYVSLEEESGKHHKDGSASERSTGSGSRRSSTTTKQDDLEDEVDHGASADDDDEEYTEDDPDRLWCICRQPHNNRFMICCDTCEEWFHGKCVNVTKAQGKAMELKNMTWNCPPCRKMLAERNRQHAAESKNRRRASEPTSKSGSSSKLSKSAVAQKAEAAAAASAAGLAQTPEKIAAQSPATGARRVPARKSIPTEKVIAAEPAHSCVVCGKASRKDSIYCTDLCVQKYAETVGNKASGVDKGKSISPPIRPVSSTPSTPTSASKLKRTLSTKQESKSDDSIFAFHVITPGASKSTEVVPPKPKELTASQLLKTQREEAARAAAATSNSASPTSSPTKSTSLSAHSSNQPSVPGVSPNSVNAIISSTPTIVVKKITNADGKSVVKLPGKISKDSSLKMETSEDKHKSKEKESSSKRSRTTSASDSKTKAVPSRKSDSSKAKEREVEKDKDRGDGPSSEKLHRENMKKGLRELLKSRLKELPEDEQEKIMESSNNPESVASKIEEELCRIYGGANNPKCRAKYRSIFFNLKDSKNCLYYELLQGNVKPKVFVKMEPHEMASAELAEWRKRENQKEMDAIKKSELDKIAEANKILLLEKGVDDAVKVAEETRPHDISDVIDTHLQQKDKIKAPEKEKSRSSGDKSRSSSGSHGRSKRDKERDEKSSHKDKERRRSERHKSEKDTEKDRRLRDREKDSSKVKSSDLKNKSSERKHSHSKGQELEKDKSKSGKLDKQSEIKKPPKDAEISTPSESISSGDGTPSSQITPPDSKQDDVRHSTDSEQELPSSTIKTPDFTDETAIAKKDSDTKHLFQSKIVMPELGGFNASVHAVSHFSTEGLIFPESPVPVVGRISPETVWDYINKMKKTKEVIVLRLSPSTPADSEGYMTFFSYFSSRGRLGVIGGISAPLKDVYLVPLDKHSPVNRSLLPFRGPGLPTERTHCLLCVVTRHITDGSVPLPLKRKSNLAADSVAVKKRVKFGPEQESTKTTRSSSGGSKASPVVPKMPALSTTEDIKDEDDDAPYTPWEEEEEKEEINSEMGSDETISTSASAEKIVHMEDEVQKQLKELEERIAKEKQDIEKITGALAGRQTSSSIPGLDGEFPLYQEELVVKKTSSFFLSSPVKQPQASVTVVDQEPSPITKMEVSVEISEVESATVGVMKKPEVVDIIEDSSSKESESDSQNEQVMGDSEEAYSPSAMQFSDEDVSQSGPSQKEKKPEGSPKTQDLPDKEPPILEPERLEPAIKISLKNLNLKQDKPKSPSVVVQSSSPVKSAGDCIDLEPEPAPPGEVVLKPPRPLTLQTPPSNKPEPVFEALGTKFATTKKGKGPISLNIGQLPKMKININLTTKQLPVTDVDVDKSIETKEAIRAASAAILTSQNALTTAAATTLAKIEAVQSPSIQSPPAQPPMSIPIHLPPPNLQQHPGIPPPAVGPAALTHIPVHLPPPMLKQTVAPSVVINLNVPPPPIPSLRPLPLTQQSPVSIKFPSGLPLTGDFSSSPLPPGPPQLKTMPSLQPAFSPISTSVAGSVGSVPAAGFGSFGDKDVDTRTPGRGFEQTSPDTSSRVERVNLDRDSGRHDRDRGVRDLRGRNFGRRQSDRNRRNRSRSGERDRSRSRSRSRERRVRRRHTRSRSRSKSPLSKRWEARNRSRSPGKRNRLK